MGKVATDPNPVMRPELKTNVRHFPETVPSSPRPSPGPVLYVWKQIPSLNQESDFGRRGACVRGQPRTIHGFRGWPGLPH